jgi:uncharacterized protein
MAETDINNIIIYLKKSLKSDGINIEHIALFGSYVNNKNNSDSDLDLIIISDDFQGKNIFERAEMTMKPEIKTLKKFMIPMDILNMTSVEYNRAIENKRFNAVFIK